MHRVVHGVEERRRRGEKREKRAKREEKEGGIKGECQNKTLATRA
jgi:hypothetical protein